MMTANEIESMVAKGEYYPNKMNTFERAYYFCVECIFKLYQAGELTQTAAIFQKRLYRANYEAWAINQQIVEQHRKIEDSLGGYRKELNTCGCEHCQKLLKILDGREIPN